MTTPRIVIVSSVTPPHYAGGALRAYRYACRLHRNGGLVALVTEDRGSAPEEPLELSADEYLPASVIERLPPAMRADPGRSTALQLYPYVRSQVAMAVQLMVRLSKRAPFDVVHCFGIAWLNLYALAAAKLLGKKTVLETTLLGLDDPISVRTSDRFRLKGAYRAQLYSLADAYVSRSPALTSAFRTSTFAERRVVEIPNAVDVGRYHPASGDIEKRALRDRLSLPNAAKILCFVGVVSERKGLDLLFAAMRDLPREVVLLVVGPTAKTPQNRDYHARLAESARQGGFSDRVRFVGVVSNVEEYLRASDAFVFPSRREGFPNVVVEAMASGLPIVMSRLPGISDYILKDGSDAIIVAEEDASALTGAIRKLISDRDLSRRLGDAARVSALERFAPERIDRSYMALYQELLRSG